MRPHEWGPALERRGVSKEIQLALGVCVVGYLCLITPLLLLPPILGAATYLCGKAWYVLRPPSRGTRRGGS